MVVAAVLVFLLSAKLGDYFFTQDRFSQAKFFYQVGTKIFPWSADFPQRFLAVETALTKRKGDSEETNFDNLEVNEESDVLGTTTRVPVLMYHYIRVNPVASDRVGFNLSVTPANFTAQMDYLAAHGYHTITLDDLGGALFSKTSLPAKPIVITFDDGYADCYYSAYPILQSHGFKALNFIITGLVGAPNYLTWSQIEEMKNSGVFTFGAHSVHHYALAYLPNGRIKSEVTESKNVLQQHLGVNINWLAYPYGSVDNRVINIVKQAGYAGAFGTNNGSYQSTDYLFTLPRVRVGGSESVSAFAATLPWK